MMPVRLSGPAQNMAYPAASERGPRPAGGERAKSRPLPHVVAWNLTRRCNLACAHCYISAGSWHAAANELSTAECLRISDEILALHRAEAERAEGIAPGEPLNAGEPAPMFILSGGEPLLRDDLETIASHASGRGAAVVVGTNGTRLTAERIDSLKDAGVSGVALSIDSLDPRYHDRFRHGQGALEDTLAAVDRLRERRLDFVVQTSLTRGNRHELEALVAWAADAGAVAFNLYFLVETGRGSGMSGLAPAENETVLRDLARLQREYRGRMLVRSKCQPQIMRHVYDSDPESPLLNYETRCPCGVQYCRITPEGKVTPCPYMPAEAGDLRRQSFEEVWWGSELFRTLRRPGLGTVRNEADDAEVAAAGRGSDAVRSEAEDAGESAAGRGLGGKCGRCEYRAICGGCRARAFAATGDPLGPDESCAYEPTGRVSLISPPREVSYGAAAAVELDWTPEARNRLQRIPSFVRGVVSRRIEDYARAHGHDRITPALMDEIRSALPVDFSKRRPFFMRGRE